MIRGIYSAASGIISNFRRQLIVTNNLANVQTTGYKQDLVAVSDLPNRLAVKEEGARTGYATEWDSIGALGTGAELGEIRLDLTQGDFAETGNPLDLAINGPGFFPIQTPTGTLFTRDGAFYRDASGMMARADGSLLLGVDGPIDVGQGDVLVDGDGTVSVDGQVAGRIRLVEFDPEMKLLKLGNNYLAPENLNGEERTADGAVINQGFLERSNVDLTTAAVEMLSAMRSYEAGVKALQLQDQVLERTVNEIGKV